MKDEPIIAELQRMLDEADWLTEEGRTDLVETLEQFRVMCAMIALKPGVAVKEMEKMKEETRQGWLNLFDKCRAEVDALLHEKAREADGRRELMKQLLRNARKIRSIMEGGTYTGTWEQREKLMEEVHRIEAMKAAFLREFSEEDIRQLEDEGVL